MELEEVDALRARWGRGRRLFWYFKQRYALALLAYLVPQYDSMGALKRSPYASLLQKPLVRELVKQRRGALLTPDCLREVWTPSMECYRLSLGQWPLRRNTPRPGWGQSTRDRWNVVLQLSFNRGHVARFKRLVADDKAHGPYDRSHPVAPKPDLTLAWVRMDIDLPRGQALIEEVQSDWVEHASLECYGRTSMATRWRRYERHALRPHARQWSEAALCAAIEYLHGALGIADIYYHSFRTGNVMKHMKCCHPPRSLYTRLPRQFCFASTTEAPRFVVETARGRQRRCLRRRDNVWFRLRLPDSTVGGGAHSVPPWQALTSSSTGTEPEAAAETPGRWSSS